MNEIGGDTITLAPFFTYSELYGDSPSFDPALGSAADPDTDTLGHELSHSLGALDEYDVQTGASSIISLISVGYGPQDPKSIDEIERFVETYSQTHRVDVSECTVTALDTQCE